MIKINEKEYHNYDIKIDWGKFEAKVCGRKINGESPFIIFNIENNIYIGLEFIFSKKMFNKMEINKKINLNKYISDITYEDKKGWISIVTGNYECNVTKVKNDCLKLEFLVEPNELDVEEFGINNIEIETYVNLL